MSKPLGAVLCGALLLSGASASLAETSLLDRLAEESIIGDGSPSPSTPALAPPPVSPSAKQLDQLKRELNEALAKKQEVEAELALLNAKQQSSGSGSTVKDAGASDKENAGLRQQIAELQAQNKHLTEQGQGQSKALADLQVANQQLMEKQNLPPAAREKSDASSAKRITIDAKASKDVLISYALGAWYGDSAPHESRKLRSIDRMLDVPAFAQGFNDKLTNAMQVPQDKLAAELAGVEKQLNAAMLSKNEKISKTLLAEALKEKGAVKMPDGTIYRVVDKGKTPLVTAQSDILLEVEEKLGTGEVLSPAAANGNKVSELPPAFQTVVTQMGLGGTAKFLVPANLIEDSDGVPPGMIVVMTLKIVGIK
ncbi:MULTISPECIES: FKBP-type peptidyl-prolyl cis-trans isomerase [Pseudomonas]|uniref:FKBP-type peptidyl-prolyl cis-trans isomerase n=1 Tax=Pseudomonas TaxID=286 RepID=UPI002362EACB|nr:MULTISPECIES: FKBP-type peptidyl-prolyl cis-trans isomerase N-terminal domain-containing protein [Pseudomonas]WJV25532.1 FKBP-type peptidyl-prolyl cis-trans isomerase N-terminal domain-containing protein [Pseudomonas chlororaphis]